MNKLKTYNIILSCYDKTKPLTIIHFTDFRYE